MKVVICWAGISGYLAACWRKLAARVDVDLHVITYVPPQHDNSPYDTAILNGISHETVPFEDLQSTRNEALIRSVSAQRPDVVVVSGWFVPAYRQLPHEPALRDIPFILAMDTPWRGGMRQRVARLPLRKYLKQMQAVIVASERTWQYARKLGFREDQIVRGVYAWDEELFGPVAVERQRDEAAPRKFLYVGRYMEQKGVDVLLRAYEQYRRSVRNPWTLTCCGTGEIDVTRPSGVDDRGFVQPSALPAVFREHGALILPSRYEPWGVVVAEALGAGMPVICSEAVCAAVDLVRSYFDGLVVPTGDAGKLAEAMCWMHENEAALPEMGRRGSQLAAAFSSEMWAIRWDTALRDVVVRGKGTA